jgi:hypothetical protein
MTERQQRLAGAENRREDRAPLHPGLKVELRLKVDGAAEFEVESLRNVSASGASLLVKRPLPVGSAASVIVLADGVRMEFLSNVAWCRPAVQDGIGSAAGLGAGAGEAVHAIGLQLRGPGSFAAMLRASS